MAFEMKTSILLVVVGSWVSGCSGSLDLAKIVGKNIAYEMQHPVQPPAAKLKWPPEGNPGANREIIAGFIGHSTVIISFYGTQILTDPNFAGRIKVARRVVGLPIDAREIRNLDLILISHPHYDHLDISSLKELPQEALLIVPEGCKDLVNDLGYSRVMEMKWNEQISENGIQIKAIKPAHWGRRSPWDDNHRGYNSYLLTKNGKSILFAGDTGYSKIFAQEGKDREIVAAFFPIGAYKPDWFERNHATPEQALKMFLESGAKYMIPIHWGTFILSHEPIEEPMQRLKAEAKRLGIEDRVVILKHGEKRSFVRGHPVR